MLRRLLGRELDFLSSSEETALSCLASAHRRLITHGGGGACSSFLESLDAASQALRLETAPRSYRSAFTMHYRAFFPDKARNYCVDVLQASMEHYAVTWVNGDKFEFSAEAMRRAEALQKAWADVCALLARWSQAESRGRENFRDRATEGADSSRSQCRPIRSEVRNSLVSLDFAWASFEHKYIAELIEIEEKARRLIVRAIEQERKLQLLEIGRQSDGGEALEQLSEYQEQLNRLVASVSHLNSVANFHRKGRDDLNAQVLHDAVKTLRRCDVSERNGENTEVLRAARILCTGVVESFFVMRDYLREVEHSLEWVDPHLCNNAGLVSRLVDWEESWEVGARYVQNKRLLYAICDLVAEIRAAQRIAPAFTTMCEDCDVELFLILPRIMWLRFLAKPFQLLELLSNLLPHRFDSKGRCLTAKQAQRWDSELESFMAKFYIVRGALIAARSNIGTTGCTIAHSSAGTSGCTSSCPDERFSWELLLKRVVSGAGGAGKDDLFSCLAPNLKGSAQVAVEDLMHELEKWSIELQRHCPDDWNQCCAIIVQCLTGAPDRQNIAFHV